MNAKQWKRDMRRRGRLRRRLKKRLYATAAAILIAVIASVFCYAASKDSGTQERVVAVSEPKEARTE